MLQRFALLTPLVLLLVFVLFWLMAKLISPGDGQVRVLERLIAVDFLKASQVPERQRPEAQRLEQAPELKQAPKPVDITPPKLALNALAQQDIDLDMPTLDLNLSVAAPDSLATLNYASELNDTSPEPSAPVAALPSAQGGANGEFSGNRELMAVRESTLSYPPKAKRRRVEGWVVFNYLVSASGEVVEVEIVDAQPPRIFERVVLKEVRKWKYLPRLVNGEPQATRVTERKYVFEL